MNGRTAKKIRKASSKAADKRFMAMVGQIGQLPFRQRLWFALKIVKGTSAMRRL
jgi:hypothetical protein